MVQTKQDIPLMGNNHADNDRPPLTDAILRFALETRIEDIPSDILAFAKQLILDTLGVTLAASNRSVGRIITRYVIQTGSASKAGTVVGGGVKVVPHLAALANGTMANALDFDGGFHHPTVVLPTALAVAEQRTLAGMEVLAAFVVGMEIAGRLQQAIEGSRGQTRGPTERGWWHVKLIGPIVAAATAARLFGLSPQQAAMAVGIASCGSGGFRRSMGTMAKGFHSGCAARDGIEAAELAAMGFTGDPAILEAPLGFFDAVCMPGEHDFSAITQQLGKPYMATQSIGIKHFPACAPAHRLIDAALALHSPPGIDVNRIQSIEADLSPFSLLRLNPTDEESAGFSGAYVLAVTLMRGKFGLDEISEKTLNEPEVRGLMNKIEHVPSQAGKQQPVIVYFTDGSERRTDIQAYTRRKMTGEAEIEQKFLDCATRALTKTAAEELRDRVLNLEQQDSIQKMMTLACGDVAAAG